MDAGTLALGRETGQPGKGGQGPWASCHPGIMLTNPETGTQLPGITRSVACWAAVETAAVCKAEVKGAGEA